MGYKGLVLWIKTKYQYKKYWQRCYTIEDLASQKKRKKMQMIIRKQAAR